MAYAGQVKCIYIDLYYNTGNLPQKANTGPCRARKPC